jgi:leucyl aminopeptidase (aminopeptidase T)
MTELRWGEFADVAVRRMAKVKPGENLLILADTWTNMEIAQACLIAGLNAKANTQLLVISKMSRTDTREFNPSTTGAILGADVILSLCEVTYIYKEAGRKARDKGIRIAATVPRGMEDYVIEGILDIDYPAMIKMMEKVKELWEKTDVCKVTSPLGTDISFRLKGRLAWPEDGIAAEDDVGYFPGGLVAIGPIEETINGTIVIDGSISPGGLISVPIICHVEKGVITAIESGPDANAWRSRLESTGDPKAFNVAHFTVGVNPRAKMSGVHIQDERVYGSVTFGFGHQDRLFQGTAGVAKIHCDAVLTSPSVTLDGVLMCEKNRFNPDLGLGAVRVGMNPEHNQESFM